MKAAIRSLQKHHFFTLSFGVAAANAISFASMPLLARLFGSESFGIFAVYYSFTNLIGLPSCFRFELAIPIAASDEEANHLSTLSVVLVGAVSLVVAAVFLFEWPRGFFSTIPEGYTVWLLTAVSILFTGLTQVLVQRCIRLGHLRILSLRPMIERLAFVGFGLLAYRAQLTLTGLIWAQALAIIASLVPMAAVLWRPSFSNVTARKYMDFPRKNMASILLQLVSQQVPILIYARYFSATELGFLSLAQRLIDSPISLLSSSFQVIYYRRLILAARAQFRRIFVRTVTLGALILGPPCLIAGLFADPILDFLFGAQWTPSHIFFIVLLPLAFTKMLFMIHQSYFLVLRRLGAELYLSVALFGAQFLGILVGFGMGQSLLVVSALSALLMAMVYVAGLGTIFRLVRSPAARA